MRRFVASPLGIFLALAMGLTSCTQRTSVTSFELAEFSISGPDRLAAGTISISANNAGEFAHTMVVTNDQGQVVAATDLIQPGDSADLELELSAGKFSITCRIVFQTDDGQLVDHYEAGMNKTVIVSG